MGLALGVVFVPCAGPVLAFVLGGNKVGKRVDFFQTHQWGFRFGEGVVVIAMAGAIAVGAPAWLQQKLPSPEFGQEVLAKGASSSKAGQQVPEFQGLTGWFNTDVPVDPCTNGKVTLIDFWAYACINCQRNNVHLTKIYDRYKDSGLKVVGIHAPEYSFEHEAVNVQRAARQQGILRESHHSEGDYAETEEHIRELLKERDPNIQLPAPLESADRASTEGRNPETYLGTAVRAGENFEVLGLKVQAVGGLHEETHPTIPRPEYMGFFFGGILHPGDQWVRGTDGGADS